MNEFLHKDPAIIEFGAVVLADMKSVCKALVHAALLTDDGFEVVRLPEQSTDHGRFASMASSMQALGDAVARELKLGQAQYLIVASATGYVVQLRVPGQALVLSALFDEDETVGKALAMSRSSAEKLASYLSEQAA